MRTLTEAQRAATKERREKFRKVVRQIADLPEAERIALSRRVSILTCEGRSLSLHNQCLLATQCPTATIVGGFRQWKKQGRYVNSGPGSGLMIWVPSVYGARSDDTPQPGEIDGKEAKSGVRFLVGTVFDIAQTSPIDGATVEPLTDHSAQSESLTAGSGAR